MDVLETKGRSSDRKRPFIQSQWTISQRARLDSPPSIPLADFHFCEELSQCRDRNFWIFPCQLKKQSLIQFYPDQSFLVPLPVAHIFKYVNESMEAYPLCTNPSERGGGDAVVTMIRFIGDEIAQCLSDADLGAALSLLHGTFLSLVERAWICDIKEIIAASTVCFSDVLIRFDTHCCFTIIGLYFNPNNNFSSKLLADLISQSHVLLLSFVSNGHPLVAELSRLIENGVSEDKLNNFIDHNLLGTSILTFQKPLWDHLGLLKAVTQKRKKLYMTLFFSPEKDTSIMLKPVLSESASFEAHKSDKKWTLSFDDGKSVIHVGEGSFRVFGKCIKDTILYSRKEHEATETAFSCFSNALDMAKSCVVKENYKKLWETLEGLSIALTEMGMVADLSLYKNIDMLRAEVESFGLLWWSALYVHWYFALLKEEYIFMEQLKGIISYLSTFFQHWQINGLKLSQDLLNFIMKKQSAEIISMSKEIFNSSVWRSDLEWLNVLTIITLENKDLFESRFTSFQKGTSEDSSTTSSIERVSPESKSF